MDNCVGPHSRPCFSAHLCLGLQTEGLSLDPRHPAGGDRRERDRRQGSALGPHQGSLRVGQPWPTLLVVELLMEATRGFLRESKVLIAWHHPPPRPSVDLGVLNVLLHCVRQLCARSGWETHGATTEVQGWMPPPP